MYAKLCKVINQYLSNYFNTDKNIFKTLLLGKCKEEFENRKKAFELFDDQDAPLSIDDEEKRALAKQKMLGNIKFICELGKQELLNKNIFHECIMQLLQRKKSKNIKDHTQDLECLCEIMKNIGHILEEKLPTYMDQYFDRINLYAEEFEKKSRIRLMLLNVIELRNNHWNPRQKIFNSVSDETVESDNGMLSSQYDTLYPMATPFTTRHDHDLYMNQFRSNDVFSHVPIGPIYLGTGPGAINDTNFYLNNQRRQNYHHHQKNVGYLGNNNNYLGNMNPMKRDLNYNRQNYQSNNINNNTNNANNNNNYNSGGGGGGNMSTNGSNPMMNSREQTNLPPRFQKQMKIQPTSNNPSGFHQSFMNKNNNNNDRGDDRNNMMNKPNHPMMMMKSNDKGFNLNNNKQQHAQQQHPFKPNTFNKFLNQNMKNMNGGKDPSNLITDMNRLKLDDQTNNQPSKNEPVNVFLKIEKLLLEYYNSEKPEEIINFLKTTNANFDETLISIMRISIGKTENERDLTNKLINKLKTDSVVSEATFTSALKSLFAKISELEVETPRARSYVAAYVAFAITENVITLKEIGDLLDGGLHYPLFPLILQNLHKSEGQTWLFDTFTESKINLMNMVPENDRNKERMADILEDRNLTFLYPMLRIESDITKQITSDCSPNSLYRWLKENVNQSLQNSPEFISVVFSTLLKHIISKHNNPDNPFQFTASLFSKQESELIKYSQVLQVFLNGKPDLQLVVLYSLQTYCHKHNFPKGLIEKWFNMLYEHEIVDEEVFFKWREDINDEYPDKGKALFQVNKWLTWLEQDDDDEEED